jgi:L-lactate dehydrogenase
LAAFRWKHSLACEASRFPNPFARTSTPRCAAPHYRQGATYYGIGSALSRIVDVILHDQRAVMTVGAPSGEVAGIRNVTLSLPRLVGGQGVLETFPLPLSQNETVQLCDSARVIRQALDELGDNT